MCLEFTEGNDLTPMTYPLVSVLLLTKYKIILYMLKLFDALEVKGNTIPARQPDFHRLFVLNIRKVSRKSYGWISRYMPWYHCCDL